MTYKGAKRAAKVLALVPHELAVLETDCPYMSCLLYTSTICGTLGGVLGVLAWCGSVPDFPAGAPLTALAVGIVSGLAATGTNQLIRQLKQPE